jgi:hypothetical protein
VVVLPGGDWAVRPVPLDHWLYRSDPAWAVAPAAVSGGVIVALILALTRDGSFPLEEK